MNGEKRSAVDRKTLVEIATAVLSFGGGWWWWWGGGGGDINSWDMSRNVNQYHTNSVLALTVSIMNNVIE